MVQAITRGVRQLTFDNRILGTKLGHASPDDDAQVRDNLRQVVGQVGAQVPDKSNTLGSSPVEPVEAVHGVYRL